MQKLWPVLVGCLALTFDPHSVRAGDFEGVLHMSTTHAATNSSSTMDWYLKGDKARVEMSRGEGATNVMNVDARTRTMQMAMDGQKAYIEIKLAEEGGEQLKQALEQQTVERTGKTDKIAGYSCEIWRITDREFNRLRNVLCVAKGFGRAASFWADPKEMKRSSQPSWVKQLVDEGGFGLRSIHYDETGRESSRMEVTKIESKKLDVGLFAFPADWSKQDMSGIQDRMKAMREQRGQGSEDFSKMMEQMKRRKTAPPGEGEGRGDGADPDVKDIMKQLGEMMKKQQQPPDRP